MALRYLQQPTNPLFGTKLATAPFTRTPVPLTAAFTGNVKQFETGGMAKINLDVNYTTGAGETASSLNILVEDSIDGVNFYKLQNEAVTAGTSTLTDRAFVHAGGTAATAFPFSIGIDVFYKYVRISLRESGVVTNFGTAFVELTMSGE